MANAVSCLPITVTTPDGEIDPCVPADAQIVSTSISPTEKSLNVVSPVAWTLVSVRVPTVGVDQTGESYFWVWKVVGSAPASTSAGAKLNVASYVENAVPPLSNVQY